jgi:hypothetical protein
MSSNAEQDAERLINHLDLPLPALVDASKAPGTMVTLQLVGPSQAGACKLERSRRLQSFRSPRAGIRCSAIGGDRQDAAQTLVTKREVIGLTASTALLTIAGR